jgi:hypothetical protein
MYWTTVLWIWIRDPESEIRCLFDPRIRYSGSPDPEKFQLGEKTPLEQYLFKEEPLENSKLEKENQWIFSFCGRVLQWYFLLLLEKFLLEHVLTLSRSKKHFPCQEDFGPETSWLWSGIQHWVL